MITSDARESPIVGCGCDGGRRGQRTSTREPQYVTRKELSVKDLTDGTYKTIKAPPMANKVSKSPERSKRAVRARSHSNKSQR